MIAPAKRNMWVMLLALGMVNIARAEATEADGLESLVIMALGALDGRAVIKTADNKMHVLKRGSVIPGTNATVTQILSDKLVLEDQSSADSFGKGQVIWLTKSGPDGKVTIQRLQRQAPPSEVLEVSGVKTVEIDKPNSKDTKKND